MCTTAAEKTGQVWVRIQRTAAGYVLVEDARVMSGGLDSRGANHPGQLLALRARRVDHSATKSARTPARAWILQERARA
jgi:hypothetical protein